MADIKHAGLLELMPQNLLDDPRIRDATEALDKTLSTISSESDYVLLISQIDYLSEDVVDLLAWQWHIDFYDDTLTLEQKRQLIKSSISWHKSKGTKKAVQDMASKVYPDGKVQEWFEYDGEPYHFRISLEEAAMNFVELERIIRLVMECKNVRSQLDAITFVKNIDCGYYIGVKGGIYKTVDIMPMSVADELIKTDIKLCNGTYLHKNISIGPAAIEDTVLDFSINASLGINNYKSIDISPADIKDTELDFSVNASLGINNYKSIDIGPATIKDTALDFGINASAGINNHKQVDIEPTSNK